MDLSRFYHGGLVELLKRESYKGIWDAGIPRFENRETWGTPLVKTGATRR